MKLADPITKAERLECLRYIRRDWWSGPTRQGEQRNDQKMPDAENPEAFHVIRLLYLFADEYEEMAKEKGKL